jgi:hypothetical protein
MKGVSRNGAFLPMGALLGEPLEEGVTLGYVEEGSGDGHLFP